MQKHPDDPKPPPGEPEERSDAPDVVDLGDVYVSMQGERETRRPKFTALKVIRSGKRSQRA